MKYCEGLALTFSHRTHLHILQCKNLASTSCSSYMEVRTSERPGYKNFSHSEQLLYLLPEFSEVLKHIQLTALTLILALALPVLSTVTLLHFHRGAVRREVKMKLANRLCRDELVPFTFERNSPQHKQLDWIHSNEFELNGVMYDVVETELNDDSISYLCWPDLKETKLVKDFDRMLADALGMNPFRRRQQKRLTRFLKKNYQLPATFQIGWFIENTATGSFKYFESYTSLDHSPPAPPPRFLAA